MDTILETRNLHFRAGDKDILKGIDISVPRGSFVGIIGPNGSGKSTLLKTVYRAQKPSAGSVYLGGKDMDKLSGKEAAKKLAALPQENELNFDFSVMELMLVGRYAHRGPLGRERQQDRDICRRALGSVGMLEFEQRSFLSLSGGEKQRVLIAGAFARGAELIVLDEPTNHLDIGCQYMLMDLMKSQKDLTVFASVHDLNLALRYCDRLIIMDNGKVAACGAPEQVLTGEVLKKIFKVHAVVEWDNAGLPYIRYIGAAAEKVH